MDDPRPAEQEATFKNGQKNEQISHGGGFAALDQAQSNLPGLQN